MHRLLFSHWAMACGFGPRLLPQEALVVMAEKHRLLLVLFFFTDVVLTNMCGGRYHQAGTPKLEVSTSYDSSAQTYTIRTKQSTPTSSHAAMQPVMLPLAVALFDKNGHEMSLKLEVSMTGILCFWCLVDCMKLTTPISMSCTSVLVHSPVFFCLVFQLACLFMLHCSLHACCVEAHLICANVHSTSQQWSRVRWMLSAMCTSKLMYKCFLQGSQESGLKSTVLRVDKEEQEFVFTDVASQPVPSLLRDFSAPVKMEVKGQTDEDLIFLLAHDTGLQAVYPDLLDSFRRTACFLSVCCNLDHVVGPVQFSILQ